MLITSPANERIKQARRVRDGREEGLIFIEGERLGTEALQSDLALIACFHTPDPAPRSEEIIDELRRRNCPLYPTADPVLATLADTVNTQGIIIIGERPAFTVEQVFAANDKILVVCLDAVQDPGNFGTIVRTAEAAGVTALASSKGSVDAFAPKTLRSSMGSAFRLPLAEQVDLDVLLTRARATGIATAAAATEGETVYSDFDWSRPALVIFGNEGRGVSSELLERCDARLRIPLCAPVESINVAAAAAVFLFEAARQRK
ncbi:MAG: RNA methyltransferase [Blastocatellia bacterium]|nr:RNA methyltransferase [Blastocatellia bacterium]